MSSQKAAQKTAQKIAVTLLSGGLDSLIATLKASETHRIIQALTFDYGQRAVNKEIQAASLLCQRYGWPHQVVKLPLSSVLPTALKQAGQRGGLCASENESENPVEGEARTDGVNQTTRRVWVPNRNGVFLNWAASVAEALGADGVVFGANAVEAQSFPDNTKAFTEAISQSLHYSTLNHVQVLSPVVDWTKAEMLCYAKENDVPLDAIWSCYNANETPCGECPSCQLFQQAQQEAAF